MTVIYVCGYGRSGSTLLGRLLAAGRGDGVVGVGEVSNIASAAFLARSECSCGHNYPRCAYWAAVHQRLVELDGGQASLSQRRRRLLEGLPGLLLPLAVLRRLVGSAAFTETYPGVPFDLGVRVLIEAGRGGVVVDISKTTRRTANRPRLLRASARKWNSTLRRVLFGKSSSPIARHMPGEGRRLDAGGLGRRSPSACASRFSRLIGVPGHWGLHCEGPPSLRRYRSRVNSRLVMLVTT